MLFFKSFIVGASALATIVAAQGKLSFTSAPTGAEAGKSYKLTWSGGESDQPVTITLREGPSSNLKTISTITSSATGGSYTWNVPGNLPAASDYALEISQGSAEPNYWNVGAISGGTASASSASSSASSIASSASASASKSVSSIVSSFSSKLSSATASSASAGTTGIVSTHNGTTITRATLSSTRSHSSNSASASSSPSSTEGSSSSSSTGAAAPSDTGNAGSGLKSNAALVLGAVAAMAYLG